MPEFSAVLLLASWLPSTPYGPADSAAWSRALNAQCPSHRIGQWIAPGNEVDLIDQFVATLPEAKRRQHHRLSNVEKVCDGGTGIRAGRSCDLIVERHGLRQMGLLHRFAAYACSNAVCTEQAICEPPELRR